MALVLLAIAGLLAAFLLYTSLGVVSKRFDSSASNTVSFKKIHDALMQFAMLNRRLPCPATGLSHDGSESLSPPSDPTTCFTPGGVVPWKAIGLAESEALDPWGRYISYRVLDGSNGLTKPTTPAPPLSDCLDELVTTTYALSGPSGAACNSTTHENSVSDFLVTQGVTVNDMGTAKKVPYVLISMGETGRGAFYPGGTAPVPPASSASKEFLNAGSLGTYWITAPSDQSVAVDDASHFDDVLSYPSALDFARQIHWGAPWSLNTVFTHGNLGVTTSNYNSAQTSLKVATSGGPVMVTAAGDTARYICGTSTNPEGVAPCTTATNGGDKMDSNAGNERLTFDFRVTRKVLVVQLTDFKATGGGDNERAQVTFYNAAGTQVDQKTVTACATSGGQRTGQYTLTPAADFTRVTITALTKTGGGNSSSAVSAIMACKITADCNTTPASWTAPVCTATG